MWLTVVKSKDYNRVHLSKVIGYRLSVHNSMERPKKQLRDIDHMFHPMLSKVTKMARISQLKKDYNVDTDEELLKAINEERQKYLNKFNAENIETKTYIVTLVNNDEVTTIDNPEGDSHGF
jgi:hypothetical protein